MRCQAVGSDQWLLLQPQTELLEPFEKAVEGIQAIGWLWPIDYLRFQTHFNILKDSSLAEEASSGRCGVSTVSQGRFLNGLVWLQSTFLSF